MALKPNKYVGLDLTLIGYIENLADVSYIWNYEVYRGCYKCIGDDVSDEVVGIEVEIKLNVEIDVGG